MASFKLGFNMAGAISAGAYTAGVLDFLFEALDEWYKAKQAGEQVPSHDVSLEVLSGASAGGMCAAIAACMAHEKFEHVHDVSCTQTTNKLFGAWVNDVDIRKLLGTEDLQSATSIPSLLDSTIIDTIAEKTLRPGLKQERPYVSQRLTLFLTLTNLKGVPYALFEGPNLTPDEFVTFHADRLRFEMTNADEDAIADDALALPRFQMDSKVWPLLQQAAMATGAFPGVLAPRSIERFRAHYARPMWHSICDAKNRDDVVPPAFPDDGLATVTTWNVDGGVTNNTPFTLAHDYLASLDPPPPNCLNEHNSRKADRAVLTIAPFPGRAPENMPDRNATSTSFFPVIVNLFSALIAQARFFGQSLASVTGGPTFSRYFIAPSDDEQAGRSALQCGLLGAFGGFLDRAFRARDFQLGRRNCQAFLDRHFVLPISNPLFVDLVEKPPLIRDRVIAEFRRPAVKCADSQDEPWLPIIPLCGAAQRTVPYPQPAKIREKSLDQIVSLILRRMKALLPFLLMRLRNPVLRFLIKWGVGALMTIFGGRAEIKDYLVRSLGNSVEK